MEIKEKNEPDHQNTYVRLKSESDFYIDFILRYKVEFSLQTPARVGTKVRFRSLRWAPYKKTLTTKEN
jgi:hypothetical protein